MNVRQAVVVLVIMVLGLGTAGAASPQAGAKSGVWLATGLEFLPITATWVVTDYKNGIGSSVDGSAEESSILGVALIRVGVTGRLSEKFWAGMETGMGLPLGSYTLDKTKLEKNLPAGSIGNKGDTDELTVGLVPLLGRVGADLGPVDLGLGLGSYLMLLDVISTDTSWKTIAEVSRVQKIRGNFVSGRFGGELSAGVALARGRHGARLRLDGVLGYVSPSEFSIITTRTTPAVGQLSPESQVAKVGGILFGTNLRWTVPF